MHQDRLLMSVLYFFPLCEIGPRNEKHMKIWYECAFCMFLFFSCSRQWDLYSEIPDWGHKIFGVRDYFFTLSWTLWEPSIFPWNSRLLMCTYCLFLNSLAYITSSGWVYFLSSSCCLTLLCKTGWKQLPSMSGSFVPECSEI